MTTEIVPGDRVRLKSGGPVMVATDVDKDQLGRMVVWCEWFDDKQKAQKDTFSLIAVEKYETPPKRVIGVRSRGIA